MTAPARIARPQPRIPLTVIGGFLGAGKTTLLNRILGDASGLRIAVLINDFGSINIDAALVRGADADTISLANGCVCCQIGDDLTDALLRVTSRHPRPDWIVIEASGVSDPWRIAQVGLVDPLLTLDGVVVLVDATCVQAQAADSRLTDAIERQLRAADLLVLNKTDGLSARECEALERWLPSRGGDAPVFRARHADVPMAALTGLAMPGIDHGASRAEGCAGHGSHAHDHAAASRCEPADHGGQFESWLFDDADAVFDVDALRRWLKAMPDGVLRAKGCLRAGGDAMVELQFAGRRGSLRRLPPGYAGNALVAIGLHGALPVDALASGLARCRVEAAGTNEVRALALSAPGENA